MGKHQLCRPGQRTTSVRVMTVRTPAITLTGTSARTEMATTSVHSRAGLASAVDRSRWAAGETNLSVSDFAGGHNFRKQYTAETCLSHVDLMDGLTASRLCGSNFRHGVPESLAFA